MKTSSQSVSARVAQRSKAKRHLRTVVASAMSLLAAFPPSVLADTFPAGACSQIPNSQTCVDSIPCKTDSVGNKICLSNVTPLPAGAFAVPEVCWQWTYQYACSKTGSDTCTDYEKNPACALLNSTCQNFQLPAGICDAWSYTYQCQTSPAVTTDKTVCTGNLFDSSGFTPDPKLNTHMAQAAVAQEMIREGQLYSDHGTNLFAGGSEYCKKGYGGIKSCCGAAPGAQSNSQMSQVGFGAAASTVKYFGEEAIDWASPYVFDAMYNNGIWLDAMTSAFATGEDTYGTTLASSGFSVGAYGFTYSTVSTAGEGVLSADTELMSFGADGSGGYLMFNPYVFAAMVIIMVVENLSSCSPAEQSLAQHKGAGLSVYEDTVCERKDGIGGAICVEWKDRYCSFNSVLAKIIQTQGKPQLGLSTSDCSGLSLEQVSAIDFSKIDFSEFTQGVAAQAANHAPTSAAISKGYQPVVSTMTGGSAQTRTLTTATSVVGTAPSPVLPLNPILPQYPPATAPAPAPPGP